MQRALLPVFDVGGTDIDLVNKIKYLDLLTNLTWKCQIEGIKENVSRVTGLLKDCKNFVLLKTLNDNYRGIVKPSTAKLFMLWLYKSLKDPARQDQLTISSVFSRFSSGKTLGTTSTCAFDRISELGPVCQNNKIWMHADAAYAGLFYLCPEYWYCLNVTFQHW